MHINIYIKYLLFHAKITCPLVAFTSAKQISGIRIRVAEGESVYALSQCHQLPNRAAIAIISTVSSSKKQSPPRRGTRATN